MSRDSTVKKFLIVRNEGNRSVKHNKDRYNLDAIIAVGYKTQSPVAMRFSLAWSACMLNSFDDNLKPVTTYTASKRYESEERISIER